MSAFTVLVVDDDPDMRNVLSRILARTPDFTLAGEADCGEAGLRLFEQKRPDVVLLDVAMPGMDGIECARRIADIDPRAILIFVTAHEQYMREAFEVYAFDYLVKPFDLKRVAETFERIRQIRSPRDEEEPPPAPPISRTGLNKLMIRQREGVCLVDMEDIILVQREDRTTVVYTAQERLETSETLSELFARLDPRLFFRSHKSYIINLSRVSRIYPYGRWTYVVKLRGIPQDALVTAARMEELEKIFN